MKKKEICKLLSYPHKLKIIKGLIELSYWDNPNIVDYTCKILILIFQLAISLDNFSIRKELEKLIDFITPWDGDFLRLDFLIYIFGYGLYLFIYLYFIYVLYRYMVQIKRNPGKESQNVELKDNDEEINNNENKEL